MSQDAERDAILAWADVCGQTGSFVDVGAHPYESLTAPLAARGWGGILIDPAPDTAADLAIRCAQNDNILVLCAAITTNSDKFGVLKWTPGEPFSSTEQLRAEPNKIVPILTPTLHPSDLARIWTALQLPIFLNVDTEGSSVPLANMLLQWIPAACVCIETDGQLPDYMGVDWAVTCQTDTNVVAVYKGRRWGVIEDAGAIPQFDKQLHQPEAIGTRPSGAFDDDWQPEAEPVIAPEDIIEPPPVIASRPTGRFLPDAPL